MAVVVAMAAVAVTAVAVTGVAAGTLVVPVMRPVPLDMEADMESDTAYTPVAVREVREVAAMATVTRTPSVATPDMVSTAAPS